MAKLVEDFTGCLAVEPAAGIVVDEIRDLPDGFPGVFREAAVSQEAPEEGVGLLVPGPLVAGVGVGVEDALGGGTAVAEYPLEHRHPCELAAIVEGDGLDDAATLPDDPPQGSVQALRGVAPHLDGPLEVADSLEEGENGRGVARATDDGVAFAVPRDLEPVRFLGTVGKVVASFGGHVVGNGLFALG